MEIWTSPGISPISTLASLLTVTISGSEEGTLAGSTAIAILTAFLSLARLMNPLTLPLNQTQCIGNARDKRTEGAQAPSTTARPEGRTKRAINVR